jgi:hypothetical protein
MRLWDEARELADLLCPWHLGAIWNLRNPVGDEPGGPTSLEPAFSLRHWLEGFRIAINDTCSRSG